MLLHPSNNPSSITRTVDGITNDVMFLRSANIPLDNSVTVYPPIVLGIITFVSDPKYFIIFVVSPSNSS